MLLWIGTSVQRRTGRARANDSFHRHPHTASVCNKETPELRRGQSDVFRDLRGRGRAHHGAHMGWLCLV